MEQVRLGQLLIDSRLLDDQKLQSALAEQKRRGGKLGEILVDLHLVHEKQLTEVLAQQLHLPTVDLDQLAAIPDEALARVPASTAHSLEALPLELLEGGRVLAVAACDVLRGARLDELRRVSRAWVVPRLCGAQALHRALLRHYGPPPLPAPRPSARVNRKSARPSAPVPLERGFQAVVELLIEKGLLNEEELQKKLAQ